MPWTVKDVESHKKGLSDKARRTWVRVANTALARCGGGPGCEAKAIRQANAVAGRIKEAAVDYWLDEATFTPKQREKLAAKGFALSDGSYPIENKEQLSDAIQAFGRAKNKAQVKAHIIKRAKALEATSMLPETWKVSEADRSYDKIRSLVQNALHEDFKEPGKDFGPWIRELFDDRVVFEQDGKTWISDYSISGDDAVSIEKPTEAEVTFVPVGKAGEESFAFPRALPAFREAFATSLVQDESWAEDVLAAAATALDGEVPAEEGMQTFEGDYIPLVEQAIRRDGTVPIKIIQPGWGSSAWYEPSVLERDGPKAFPAGTKMYWDHPTVSEEKERPERSLRDLAAEFVSDAQYEADHPKGPGLYANAKPFGSFKDSIEELAPHIGVSIRADGKGSVGEREGKRGPILEELTRGRSVDFVTEPGAGGKVLEMFESARPRSTDPIGEPKVGEQKEEDMEVKEALGLKEAAEKERDDAKTEAARLREALVIREAGDALSESFGKIEKDAKVTLLESTKQRLEVELLKRQKVPTTDDGKLDRAKFDEAVVEAVKAEVAYLEEIAGRGKVRGMGSSGPAEDDEKEITEGLEKAFERIGLSETERKVAAAGR